MNVIPEPRRVDLIRYLRFGENTTFVQIQAMKLSNM